MSKQKGAVSRLLAFAGSRRALTYLGCMLSAVSMLVSFGPYVCIWFAARDLIAVAPHWAAATDIAAYGWWALGFAIGPARSKGSCPQADKGVRIPARPDNRC